MIKMAGNLEKKFTQNDMDNAIAAAGEATRMIAEYGNSFQVCLVPHFVQTLQRYTGDWNYANIIINILKDRYKEVTGEEYKHP
jgi:hypothetical protein